MSRKVSQYMIENPITIQEDLNLGEVMKQFDNENISHLLVNNPKDELSGIISKVDVLDKLRLIVNTSSGLYYSEKLVTTTKAKDIMSNKIIGLTKNDDVTYAVELLLQKEFHCLPVVENERPIGIVTLFDLLKGYYQEFG